VAHDPERLEGVTPLQGLAERVSQGAALQVGDASVIMGSHDLIAVGMMADEVRRRMHGAATTFVRVFEMHVDAVPRELPPGVQAGEFRLAGRPASLEAAVAAVAIARRLAGNGVLTGFSLADLVALEPGGTDVMKALKDAGLDGVADVAVDRLEAPGRPTQDWGDAAAAAVARARAAGLRVERLTVHAAPGDPLAPIVAALELQAQAGGFRAFAPLPRAIAAASPSTGFDDVKLVAMARLLIAGIPSIQVDWPLYGPKLAQVALTVGADDVDGVAAVEPGVLGARRNALEAITGNIRAAGLQPVERNGRHERAA
jgi:aminodeoxyfutalosine synthase